jgi:hypothetical protein
MVPLARTPDPKQRAPLYDIHPTGISIEVFWADRTLETFGRGGGGWFLVAAPTRLFARRSGDWTVFDELRGVSQRDEYGSAVRRRRTARHSLTHNVNTDTVRT